MLAEMVCPLRVFVKKLRENKFSQTSTEILEEPDFSEKQNWLLMKTFGLAI
jgi:hypothetical protein